MFPIIRAPGLKIIVNAILASAPDVLNVFLVVVLLLSIFAILGVNLLKGKLVEHVLISYLPT